MDVVFPVLHGTFGEDGTVQHQLESLNVAFTVIRLVAVSHVTMTIPVPASLPDSSAMSRSRPRNTASCAWSYGSSPRYGQPSSHRGTGAEGSAGSGCHWPARCSMTASSSRIHPDVGRLPDGTPRSNIFVVSDHGFSTIGSGPDIPAILKRQNFTKAKECTTNGVFSDFIVECEKAATFSRGSLCEGEGAST